MCLTLKYKVDKLLQGNALPLFLDNLCATWSSALNKQNIQINMKKCIKLTVSAD